MLFFKLTEERKNITNSLGKYEEEKAPPPIHCLPPLHASSARYCLSSKSSWIAAALVLDRAVYIKFINKYCCPERERRAAFYRMYVLVLGL